MENTTDFDIREWLPEWSPIRWTIIAIAGLVLAVSGISLFHTPSHEVIYSVSRFLIPSEQGDQLVFVTMEVGNTGNMTQEEIEVRFKKAPVVRSKIAPSARNFGVSERPVRIVVKDEYLAIFLGEMAPEKRVRLTVCLTFPREEEIPKWDELFLGVHPDKGKALKGDPGMAVVGRAWYSMFTDWLP